MSATLPNSPTLMPGPLASPQAEQLPHGLRGLLAYRFSWDSLWPWLALSLGSLIVLGILYHLWKKYKNRPSKPVAPEDPFLTLERQLHALLPPQPFSGKPGTQYFFELSMLFRQFLELSSGVQATDLTLQELKEPLRRKSSLSRETTEEVIKFLERCDYVKFAGIPADLAEAQASHTQVLQWVRYLRPRRLESEGQ